MVIYAVSGRCHAAAVLAYHFGTENWDGILPPLRVTLWQLRHKWKIRNLAAQDYGQLRSPNRVQRPFNGL